MMTFKRGLREGRELIRIWCFFVWCWIDGAARTFFREMLIWRARRWGAMMSFDFFSLLLFTNRCDAWNVSYSFFVCDSLRNRIGISRKMRNTERRIEDLSRIDDFSNANRRRRRLATCPRWSKTAIFIHKFIFVRITTRYLWLESVSGMNEKFTIKTCKRDGFSVVRKTKAPHWRDRWSNRVDNRKWWSVFRHFQPYSAPLSVSGKWRGK